MASFDENVESDWKTPFITSSSDVSQEGTPVMQNPVNTDDCIPTVPVPSVQDSLSDTPRGEPSVSSAASARRSGKAGCIFCCKVKYERRHGCKSLENLQTSRSNRCQSLLRAATLRKDERVLDRLQRRIADSSAHNTEDVIRYHKSCYKSFTKVLYRPASNSDGASNLTVYARTFDKFCSTVIEPRIINGHENVTTVELKKLYDQIAKEEEKTDLSRYRKHKLKDRLVARYPDQIKFVTVKKGYPQVVVNASDHTVQSHILDEIKWNKTDFMEFTLAEPDAAGTSKDRTEEPGFIHADSDGDEEGDDYSPSSPAAPAIQLSGGDSGADLVGLEVEAEETAAREESCHLTVNRAMYDRWCSIRTAEGLETDTDLAQLFIRQYEETKTCPKSTSVCASCNTSLQLFCPACNTESTSLVASEGQQLPTGRRRKQFEPVRRGPIRPGKRRGVADKAVESGAVDGVSVAESVRGRPRKRRVAGAEDSDKIIVERVAVPSDESECDQFSVGDASENDANSDVDVNCHFESLLYMSDAEEGAESCVKLEESDICGTNIDSLEMSMVASNPDKVEYFQARGDCQMQPVAALWSVEDSSALSKEDSSALSKEDNPTKSKGDKRDCSAQCEEAKYMQCTDDCTLQSATHSDQHQPLKGVHVDLCLLQPSPSVSFPQRKTRSSSCVPAGYSVQQQKAVKSAAKSSKHKKKTEHKHDPDSDWNPSESELSESETHTTKKKIAATHHACPFCFQIFSSREFTTHLKTHELPGQGKHVKCDHCDSVFDDKTSYFEHVKQHKGGMPFSCELCLLCFMSSEDRDRHKEAHTCSQCGKVYKSLQALKIHVQCHASGKKPFKCDRCGQGFIWENTLKRHMSAACGKKERRYICEICAAAFKTGTSLRTHIKTHSDEKPYACTICNARFRSKGWRDTHLKCHRGEKPHVCELCGRAFVQSSKLRLHKRRVHYKEKPHQCHLCGYACTEQSSLKTHIRRRHSGLKQFKCEYCPRAFSDRPDLVSHTRTHTGEKPYPCKLCNATFARRDYLSKHMAIHTGNTQFVCNLCGVGFRHSTGLKRHSDGHCSAAQLHLQLINPVSAGSSCGPCLQHDPQELPALEDLSPENITVHDASE